MTEPLHAAPAAPTATPAAPATAATPLFARCLDLSREAHGRGQHEVAYHALTAAMHAASDDADARALAEIGRETEAQIAWIDRHEPGHRLSTASARRHQHPGVYAMLARQVAAHEHMAASPQLAHPSPPASGFGSAGGAPA